MCRQKLSGLDLRGVAYGSDRINALSLEAFSLSSIERSRFQSVRSLYIIKKIIYKIYESEIVINLINDALSFYRCIFSIDFN